MWPRWACVYYRQPVPDGLSEQHYRRRTWLVESVAQGGYRLVRVVLKGDKVERQEVFAEGWLQGEQRWGRPVDVLVYAGRSDSRIRRSGGRNL
jgi:hypothetical protein